MYVSMQAVWGYNLWTTQKQQNNYIERIFILMNLGSGIPNAVDTLHRIYLQTKQTQQEAPTEYRKHSKSKNKIRIKSKSQGKFMGVAQAQNNRDELYKTINLTEALKQNRNARKLMETKRQHLLIQDDTKAINSQRELLFLKQLINRRKEMPQGNETNATVSRIQASNKVNQLATMRQKVNHQKSMAQLDDQNQLCQEEGPVDKKGMEYERYDTIVRSLLNEMSQRKTHSKPSRPSISPLKYNEAKQKMAHKVQSDTQLTAISAVSSQNQNQITACNFKSAFKLLPKKESMVFRLAQCTADAIYDRKISSYLKFLYKVNFSNQISTDLSLNNPGKVYKVKIGKGNNSELIKMLIKRRFWLEIDNSLTVNSASGQQKLSFMWTQNTIDSVHKLQNQTRKQSFDQEKPVQQSNFTKKLKKYKKIGKRTDSSSQSEKILHPADIYEAEIHYEASNYGAISAFDKLNFSLISNHIPSNYIIGSKKALFLLLKWFYENIKCIDPFTYLPKTYNIKSGDTSSPSFINFIKNQGQKTDDVWIVKPGENTNRGNGINVATFSQVSKLIRRKQVHKNGQEKTYIIQRYLKPFLYNCRKFDIRHYLLITSVNGNIKAYWYRQGYIRTSSEKYDMEDLGNEFIHLTNDAIQKKSELYGKYEPGNKLSYANFQRYLDQAYPQKKYSFQGQILKKMREITTDIVQAAFCYMDPQRKNSNFQLYGMDFMIDCRFQPYLIEVNANPCLEISCPVLERIIPTLLEHTFRLGLDPLLPPPEHYPVNHRYQLSDRILENLKYELIFDEKNQGRRLREQIDTCAAKFSLGVKSSMEPDEEIFEDEGSACNNIQID